MQILCLKSVAYISRHSYILGYRKNNQSDMDFMGANMSFKGQIWILGIHIGPHVLVYSTRKCFVKTTSQLTINIIIQVCDNEIIMWLISYMPLQSISCPPQSYLPSSLGLGQIWVAWAGYGYLQGRYSVADISEDMK